MGRAYTTVLDSVTYLRAIVTEIRDHITHMKRDLTTSSYLAMASLAVPSFASWEAMEMRSFSPAEREYLSERRLGRLATIDSAGRPHVVPIGMWQLNTELGTVDITGLDFAATSKFANVRSRPKAALVVDDVAPTGTWHPRAVMVSGSAQAIPASVDQEALIRISLERIVSWGLDDPSRPS